MESHSEPIIPSEGPNKLHKREDPRGSSHRHTDSGVGIEPEERSSFGDYKTATEAIPEDRETQTLDDPKTTHDPHKVAQEHPYWGDLPQGQGTYNTVVGHGSNDDEARRHGTTGVQTDSSSSAAPRSFPLVDRTDKPSEDVTTVHEPVVLPEDSNQKERIQAEREQTEAPETVAGGSSTVEDKRPEEFNKDFKETGPYETVGTTSKVEEHDKEKKPSKIASFFHRGSSDDKDKQHTETEKHHTEKHHTEKEPKTHDDRHTKEEALGGAAVAAAGGSALYASTHKDEPESEDKEKKHGSLFGFLHRRDSKDETAHADDGNTAKELKAEDVAAVPGSYPDEGVRSDEGTRGANKDIALAAAVAAYNKRDGHGTATSGDNETSHLAARRAEEYQQQDVTHTAPVINPTENVSRDQDTSFSEPRQAEDSHFKEKALGGAAVAAAGGGALYASTRRDEPESEDKEKRHGATGIAPVLNPTGNNTRESDASYHERRLAEPYQQQDVTHTAPIIDPPVQSSFGQETIGQDTTKSSRDIGVIGGVASAPIYDTTTSTAQPALGGETIGQDTTQSSRDVNVVGGVASAPIHDTTTSTAQPDVSSSAGVTSQVTKDANQGVYDHLATGTASGISNDRIAESQGRKNVPEITQVANEGIYNTLNTGTPSGIKLESDDTKAGPTVPETIPEQKEKNFSAVPIVASHTSEPRRLEEDTKPVEKTEKKEDNFVPAAVGGSTGGPKITHACVKCGEENDISHYFKDKKAQI